MNYFLPSLFLLCSLNLEAQFSDPITIKDQWSSLRSVFLEDINEDGHLDIIVFRSFQAAYFLNDGNGNFGAEQTLVTGVNRPNHLQTGDIDNDGDLDVLVAAGEIGNFGRLSWLENDGNLNFTQHDIIARNTLITKPFSCHLADLDNDGNLDAAVTAQNNDDVFIAYNQGNGTFANAQSVNSTFDGPVAINSHDFDGDGFKEIFVANFSPSLTPRVVYLDRQSNGSYTRNTFSMPGYANPTSLDFVDIDFDSDLDLITQFSPGKRIVWSENNTSTGQINTHEDVWGDSGFSGGQPSGFKIHQAGNINTLYFYTTLHNCYRVTGTSGNFSQPELLFDETGNAFKGILKKAAFGDVDQDGLQDIVYINTDEQIVRLRRGTQESLPVVLTHFTGERLGKNVYLKWATSYESDNVGFDLEKSTDGTTWSRMEFINANESKTYAYTDLIENQYYAAKYYYRLKQIDHSGAYTYSNIISVATEQRDVFTLAPNPVSEQLTITHQGTETTNGIVYDFQLREVSAFSFSGTYILNTSDLRPGIYVVSLWQENGRYSYKFRVE